MSVDKNKTTATQTHINKLDEDKPDFSTSVVSLDDLLDEPIPEQVWLVEGHIPAAAFTIISGQPSSYKTRFALDLTLSVAQNKPLYGKIPVKKSGVLIIDEESGRRLLHRQLREQGAIKGLPIRISSHSNFKLNDTSVGMVLLECRTYNLDTVIFDSLSHIHTANENDAPEMTRVLKHLQKLTDSGITVIVITHNRKESQFTSYGGSEVRGSSAIFAAADAQLTLIPKEDGKLIVRQNKLRYAKVPKPFELLVTDQENVFGFEYVGAAPDKRELIETAVLELLAEHGKLNQKEMLEKLKDAGIKSNDHNLPPILAALVTKGKIVPLSGIGNNKYYALARATT